MKTDYDDGSIFVSFALANPAIIEYNRPETGDRRPETGDLAVP
jgi:hypothetical protein